MRLMWNPRLVGLYIRAHGHHQIACSIDMKSSHLALALETLNYQHSLPALAPELKIQIFKSMDSFSSVAILSSTSRTFHNLWKSDAKSICNAVLQRTIECLPEAQVLLDAQKSCQQALGVLALDTSQEGHGPFQQAVQRSQRLSINADTALLALEAYNHSAFTPSTLVRTISSINRTRLVDREMLPVERTHFIRAYYGAMTMVLLWHKEFPESLFASWNMLHFQRVREVLDFVLKGFPKSLRQHMVIVAADGYEPDGEWTIDSNLTIANAMLQRLDKDLLAVAPNHYLSKPPGMPIGYFIAYEDLTKTTDTSGGVQLVGLLRLLSEKGLWRI